MGQWRCEYTASPGERLLRLFAVNFRVALLGKTYLNISSGYLCTFISIFFLVSSDVNQLQTAKPEASQVRYRLLGNGDGEECIYLHTSIYNMYVLTKKYV